PPSTSALSLHDALPISFTEIDGVRWVLPGDMARVDADGTVVLLGRGSVSINSGGEKIYPEEVEAALKAHPNVFDAVVVGTPDARDRKSTRLNSSHVKIS